MWAQEGELWRENCGGRTVEGELYGGELWRENCGGRAVEGELYGGELQRENCRGKKFRRGTVKGEIVPRSTKPCSNGKLPGQTPHVSLIIAV